jgi:hypothetical protein
MVFVKEACQRQACLCIAADLQCCCCSSACSKTPPWLLYNVAGYGRASVWHLLGVDSKTIRYLKGGSQHAAAWTRNRSSWPRCAVGALGSQYGMIRRSNALEVAIAVMQVEAWEVGEARLQAVIPDKRMSAGGKDSGRQRLCREG